VGPISQLFTAISQLFQGFSDWRRWAWLGMYDVHLLNRRSFFGMWWPTLSIGIFAFGVGHLFAVLMGRSLDVYLPHLAIGMVVWQLIIGGIVQGSGVFISSLRILEESILPANTLALRLLTRLVVQFLLGLAVVAAVFLYLQKPLTPMASVAALGLVLDVIVLHGTIMFLGFLCARFRDVQHLIDATLRLVFFLTPIIWIPTDERGGRSIIVDFNPFYYMVEVIRTPIDHGEFPALALTVVFGLAIVSNLFGLGAFALFRRKLMYWI
jgi:lipopolysaccharide transport system permease protein